MVSAALTGCAALGPVRSAGAVVPIRLCDAAAEANVLFGTSIAQDALDDPALGALYRRESGVLVADWATLFSTLRPEVDAFDTSYADGLIAFAEDAGLKLHGHALAWNESRPDWLMNLSTAEMATALDRHIDETAAHFAGTLEGWNVVNEPFWGDHGLPGGWRDGPWYQAFGPDYVVRAFRRAEAVIPEARLVLNEAMTEPDTPHGDEQRAGMLRLVDTLQDAGVKLSAVGLQAHLMPQWAYDEQKFTDFLGALADRKVEVNITELDVNDEPYPDDPLIRDAAVADRYELFLKATLAFENVKRVITWQLADRASHYYYSSLEADPDAARRPRPLPFDAELQPKTAYRAMLAAFESRRQTLGL